VNSRPGEGSCLAFEMEFEIPEPSSSPFLSGQNLKVLFVDDDKLNRMPGLSGLETALLEVIGQVMEQQSL
jgi:hypothetical protein